MFVVFSKGRTYEDRRKRIATLIKFKDSDGKNRRCSAVCYNAKGEVCTCICCGGKNHGVGLRQATVNTQLMAEELIKEGMRLGVAARQAVMEV